MGGIAVIAGGLPMLVAAGTLLLQRPDVIADGDFAVDEIALMRSTHFAQLVGNYSRYGWDHLGPAWFYLLDLFYAPLGQHSWAFFVATLAVHGIMAILIIAAAWRIRGPLLATVTAVLVLWFITRSGLPVFRNPWPPFETILPMILFLLLAGLGGAGSTLAMVGALLVGSYEAQLHVGTVPAVGIVLLGMAVMRLIAPRFTKDQSRVPDVRGGSLEIPLIVLGLVTLVAMWAPVAVDELTGHPGNLTKLATFFLFAHLPHHHLREGVAALGRLLAVFPFGHPPGLSESDYSTLTATRLIVVAVFLALSGALGVAATALRDRFAQCLGVVLFLLTIGLVWSISRIIGDLYSYLLLWTTTLPLVLAIGWAALLIGRVRAYWLPAPFHRPAAGVLAVGTTAVLLALTIGQTRGFLMLPSPAAAVDRGTRATTTLVQGSLSRQPREPMLVTITTLDAWPTAAGVALQLLKNGWSVSFRREYLFMFGDQTRASGRERLELVFVAETNLPQFGQQAAGLQFLGSVADTNCPQSGTRCALYVFLRKPSSLP